MRPPLGVLNLWDVAIFVTLVILVPLLYVVLPVWLVVVLLGLGTFSSLYLVVGAVIRMRQLTWLVCILAMAADIGIGLAAGTDTVMFAVVNDGLLMIVVIAVSNLWAQTGMKARDSAVMAGALAVYDFVSTAQQPLMPELVDRLARMPFAPQIRWPSGGVDWMGLGLGDVLLASVFPLVLRKAFGRTPGLVAMGMAVALVSSLFAVAGLGILSGVFPVMAVLGPAIVVQYAFWRIRCGAERTMWKYQQACEPPLEVAQTWPSERPLRS
jgi:hypothetical protein